jgi:hypothetical protein
MISAHELLDPRKPPRTGKIVGFEDCRLFATEDGRLWASATVADESAEGRREMAALELDRGRHTIEAVHMLRG